MQDDRGNETPPSRIANALKDVHFWVPVAVLLGGLLLLRFIH